MSHVPNESTLHVRLQNWVSTCCKINRKCHHEIETFFQSLFVPAHGFSELWPLYHAYCRMASPVRCGMDKLAFGGYSRYFSQFDCRIFRIVQICSDVFFTAFLLYHQSSKSGRLSHLPDLRCFLVEGAKCQSPWGAPPEMQTPLMPKFVLRSWQDSSRTQREPALTGGPSQSTSICGSPLTCQPGPDSKMAALFTSRLATSQLSSRQCTSSDCALVIPFPGETVGLHLRAHPIRKHIV